MADNTDFFIERQKAVERMREMSNRKTPPVPDFIKLNEKQKTENKSQNEKQNFAINLPFLKEISNDSDISLILGLALLLFSEKADKFLLFALVYILM